MPMIPPIRSVSPGIGLPVFGQKRKMRINHARDKALFLEQLTQTIQNGPQDEAFAVFQNLPLHPELHDVATHLAHMPEAETKNLFRFLVTIADSLTPAQRTYYSNLFEMQQHNPESAFVGSERRKSNRKRMESDALFLLSRPKEILDKQLREDQPAPVYWLNKLSRMEPEQIEGLLLAMHYELVPQTARKHDLGMQQRRERRVFGR